MTNLNQKKQQTGSQIKEKQLDIKLYRFISLIYATSLEEAFKNKDQADLIVVQLDEDYKKEANPIGF